MPSSWMPGKGIGCDLQSDSGLYLEHTPWVTTLDRMTQDSDWRDGASSLKGMGKIRATVNTALAASWQLLPGSALGGRAPCRSGDDQGVNYQASVTLLPLQSDTDTVTFQTAALFGDARYVNTWYGVSDVPEQP